jgi:hypothetical protein
MDLYFLLFIAFEMKVMKLNPARTDGKKSIQPMRTILDIL